MVGLPASGKSTYVDEHYSDAVIVSSDAIIEKIAAEQGLTYSEVFADAMKIADAQFWNDIHEAVAQNKNLIVVDRTNMSVKSRARFVSIAHKNSYGIEAVLFPPPSSKSEEEILYKRLSDRGNKTGKVIPKFVLNSMIRSYVEPSIEEGFSKILKVNNLR